MPGRRRAIAITILPIRCTPRTLADLAHHRVVHYTPSLNAQGACWDYAAENGQARSMPMRAQVTVNGTDAYQAAALAGLGLIQVPKLGTEALVASGRLIEVLPQWCAPAMPVSLLLPHRRQLAPRVQAVMAWLTQVVTPLLAPTA